ncbi:MAG: AlkZ-related protein [Eubacteriales bacterium]
MKEYRIRSFSDFRAALMECGFTMAGNAHGIFTLLPWGWDEDAPYPTPVRWHTDDPETDPWEWRIRLLEEYHDVAYGKVFFGVAGFITREWYPYFLACRREGADFADIYAEGKLTRTAKTVYETVAREGKVASHALRNFTELPKEDAGKIDRAVTELQRQMFLTICGRTRKVNKYGEEYGWNSTVFCTVEDFWGGDVAMDISPEDAERKITARIRELNPDARDADIRRFIYG